jgi:hypothetical protein
VSRRFTLPTLYTPDALHSRRFTHLRTLARHAGDARCGWGASRTRRRGGGRGGGRILRALRAGLRGRRAVPGGALGLHGGRVPHGRAPPARPDAPRGAVSVMHRPRFVARCCCRNIRKQHGAVSVADRDRPPAEVRASSLRGRCSGAGADGGAGRAQVLAAPLGFFEQTPAGQVT